MTVEGNSIASNAGNGIQGLGEAAKIVNNTIRANGGWGAGCKSCLFLGNAVRDNGNAGFECLSSAGEACGYGHNVFSGNNGGSANPQVSATGGGMNVEIGTNVCGASSTCP